MSDHIKIRPAVGKWTIRAGAAVMGESENALELIEGDYPPVIYFPRGDIAMAFLDASDTITTCPYKGEAKHFSIQTRSKLIEDAAWTYDAPIEDLEVIKDHLAFYTSKVTVART